MEPYKHRPLNKKSHQIRLLRIRKYNKQDLDSSVILELRHAYPGEKDLQFNALSYAWGDEQPTHEVVILDGVISGCFRVRQNLYDYFLVARISREEWSTEWIWIDQICIDQIDHDERCHQVSQMADLYSATSMTVVWPGQPSVYHLFRSNELYELLEEEFQSSANQAIFGPRGFQSAYEVPILGAKELGSANSTPIKLRSWETDTFVPSEAAMRLIAIISPVILGRLVLSPYWERLWIIQEFCLPCRVCVVILGEIWELDDVAWMTAVLLDKMKNLHRTLIDWLGDEAYVSLGAGVEDLWTRLQGFAYLRLTREDETGKMMVCWFTVLLATVKTRCTEPLDRVYGVMSFLVSCLRVYPNYKIEPKQLLKAILEKQISYGKYDSRRRWFYLNNIIKIWPRTLKFEAVRQGGIIDQSHEFVDDKNFFSVQNLVIYHNVGLVLEDLKIPIPSLGLKSEILDIWKMATLVVEIARIRRTGINENLDELLVGKDVDKAGALVQVIKKMALERERFEQLLDETLPGDPETKLNRRLWTLPGFQCESENSDNDSEDNGSGDEEFESDSKEDPNTKLDRQLRTILKFQCESENSDNNSKDHGSGNEEFGSDGEEAESDSDLLEGDTKETMR